MNLVIVARWRKFAATEVDELLAKIESWAVA